MIKNGMRSLIGANARAAAIWIVVSCTAPVAETDRTIDLGSDPPPPESRPFEGVAKATPIVMPDASANEVEPPVMPENQSHISLRLDKVPAVLVTELGGGAYPDPYTVTQEEDSTVLTLYLRQGVRAELEMRAVDAEGNPLGDAVRFIVDPIAKIGTNNLSSAIDAPLIFSDKYERQLAMGETFLIGPVSTEFIDGETDEHEVMQGIFVPETDTVCEISWAGCGTVFSFLNGPPVPRTEPFIVSLKAGQKLGLYPVVDSAVEEVRFSLHEPACTPPEE